ncbi:histidinol-phosphate transaminase [Variovorax terrae]|uniref:Histidinol-phosphate aminotransferase n=1 Tax=Variovorax terrae TaxID=2923278 RepID=A0A9X1VYJ6_9BURK|nr:histidinol-phosphate transaminase [Variovorax terrae]MCJ0766021.1 histidinol-phosphate transaminase [Variovorax terrae]
MISPPASQGAAASMLLLASNENPLGMPESARRAVAACLGDAGCYPDANGTALKQALAERLGLGADWLTLGSGSSEILELAAQVCVEPGQKIVYSEYGFIVYGQAAAHARAQAVVVPARDFGHDLGAMRAAIDGATRLVFIANPNNPTGTLLAPADLLAFIEAVPAGVAVLLDEAYTEYLAPAQRYDSMAWVRRFPHLIVARTFSKAYGLAGLRIGYGAAQPALTARLNARRPRFNVSTPAQAAARAALADADWLARSYDVNTAGRSQLEAGFRSLGLHCVPSHGNFVLVRVGDAPAVHAALLARGIEVSRVDPYGLPQWLRVSVGLPEHNSQLLDALGQALAAAG